MKKTPESSVTIVIIKTKINFSFYIFQYSGKIDLIWEGVDDRLFFPKETSGHFQGHRRLMALLYVFHSTTTSPFPGCRYIIITTL